MVFKARSLCMLIEDHVLGMQMLREIETMGRNQQKRQKEGVTTEMRGKPGTWYMKLNEEGVWERNDRLYTAVWIMELWWTWTVYEWGAWKVWLWGSRRMGGEELKQWVKTTVCSFPWKERCRVIAEMGQGFERVRFFSFLFVRGIRSYL